MAFWDTVRESDNPAMYEAYLEKYSEGAFAAGQSAARRIAAVKRTTRRPTAPLPPCPSVALAWVGSSASVGRSGSRIVARAGTR